MPKMQKQSVPPIHIYIYLSLEHMICSIQSQLHPYVRCVEAAVMTAICQTEAGREKNTTLPRSSELN